VVYGKFRGTPAPAARLVVEGRSAEGAYRSEAGTEGGDDSGNVALRYLWARQRIAMLSDQEALEGGAAQQEAITALGLQYSLLTQYTSFIAVDHVVRNSNPALAPTVKQPSPMPAGVSNLAIGAEVPSTPEPGAWLALAITLGIVVVSLAGLARRVR
ncbi:MAG: trypsin, partial [Caldimonas sp.]